MHKTMDNPNSSALAEPPIRIYVGADRSQQLAIAVLEHSIRRHTTARVELTPMVDLPVPQPRDPRNGQRTGFSFSRFAICELAGHQGKALYLDADMLVFKDIRLLWDIAFDGAKVVIQQEVKFQAETEKRAGAPARRIKQCAVMLMDCGRLGWDVGQIVGGMDRGEYNYDQLMYDLCVLGEEDIRYGVPFEWNSLEHFDADTALIHYTDVSTQPWTYAGNRNAQPWLDEVRLMIADGSLPPGVLQREIDAGYFRPSLRRDLRWRHRVPKPVLPLWDKLNRILDRLSGFVPHKEVYAAKRARLEAIRRYEEAQRSNGEQAP